jgi:hypothetical protein
MTRTEELADGISARFRDTKNRHAASVSGKILCKNMQHPHKKDVRLPAFFVTNLLAAFKLSLFC